MDAIIVEKSNMAISSILACITDIIVWWMHKWAMRQLKHTGRSFSPLLPPSKKTAGYTVTPGLHC